MAKVFDPPRRFIVHAANVNSGGGQSLLRSILASLPVDTTNIVVADERLQIPPESNSGYELRQVSPTIWSRMGAERWLARNATENDLVLSFGNLPPLFKLTSRVVVFLQNRYLVDDADLNGFTLAVNLRLRLERLWFVSRIENADEVIVQTASMQRLLKSRIAGDFKISVFPFTNGRGQSDVSTSRDDACGGFDFIYVASGEPHKNHRRLVAAWSLLAQEDLYPSLALTLDVQKFPLLCTWIRAQVDRWGLKIDLVGITEGSWTPMLRPATGALIYPSTLESFGLPLIEARAQGVPVVASELDYVRDLLDPDQAFDPRSEVSIARAVKRHLGRPDPPIRVYDAGQFIDFLFAGNRE